MPPAKRQCCGSPKDSAIPRLTDESCDESCDSEFGGKSGCHDGAKAGQAATKSVDTTPEKEAEHARKWGAVLADVLAEWHAASGTRSMTRARRVGQPQEVGHRCWSGRGMRRADRTHGKRHTPQAQQQAKRKGQRPRRHRRRRSGQSQKSHKNQKGHKGQKGPKGPKGGGKGKAHVSNAAKDGSIRCDFDGCGRSFTVHSSLYRHMRQCHNWDPMKGQQVVAGAARPRRRRRAGRPQFQLQQSVMATWDSGRDPHFPGYFQAIVTHRNLAQGTCGLRYEDGAVDPAVPLRNIRAA